jgi:arsenite methyltransferase
MATMTWFWRLVCEPECSDACQTDCPGCRALAAEWESKGHVLPETGPPPRRFRWSKLPAMWRCFSRSASARLIARLAPGRHRPAETPTAVAESCCTPVASDTTVPTDELALREQVLEHCGGVASAILASSADSCCAAPTASSQASALESAAAVNLTDSVYSGVSRSGLAVATRAEADLAAFPVEAVLASLGCGNPLARAQLRPGEVVLDLGSGGGLDVVAAASRVGPTGKVIGLDMSDDMLKLARANAAKAGAANAEFVKGPLEDMPLPDSSVDVIISNCVLPVLPDKRRVMREAFRVLRPGGRLALSDIVTQNAVPDVLKKNLTAWLWCLGGALSEDEYREYLTEAGFTDVVVSRDRVYTMEDAEASGLMPILREAGMEEVLNIGYASSGIVASKPGGTSS